MKAEVKYQYKTSAVPILTLPFWNGLFARPVLMLRSYYRIIP